MLLIPFFYYSCNIQNKQEAIDPPIFIDKGLYNEIYNKACDSIRFWNQNNFYNYSTQYGQIYELDSLLCFNKSGERFISNIHRFRNTPGGSDELLFFLGEKLEKNWYFFCAASVTLPREMYKTNTSKPLSYLEMHQIGLKEIYGGYLKPNGEINENWFISHFESNGWGNFEDQSTSDWFLKGKRYSNKKEFYEAVHLSKVKSNWLQRDTTKPIIYLPKKDSVL